MKVYMFLIPFVLFGCAPDMEPSPGDEPVAGSVAVSALPLTQTVTLQSVFTHFGTNVTYQTLSTTQGTIWRPVLGKQLYWRVGDTATFPVQFGWYPGTLGTAEQHVCKILSGRKLYLMSNGTYTKGLNLEGKLVVTQ